jgi:hypothetical protein
MPTAVCMVRHDKGLNRHILQLIGVPLQPRTRILPNRLSATVFIEVIIRVAMRLRASGLLRTSGSGLGGATMAPPRSTVYRFLHSVGLTLDGQKLAVGLVGRPQLVLLDGVGLSVRKLGVLGDRVNDADRGDVVGEDMGRGFPSRWGSEGERRTEGRNLRRGCGRSELEPRLRMAELNEARGEFRGEKASSSEEL